MVDRLLFSAPDGRRCDGDLVHASKTYAERPAEAKSPNVFCAEVSISTGESSKKLKARPKPSLSCCPLPWSARPSAFALAALRQVDMTVTSKVEPA